MTTISKAPLRMMRLLPLTVSMLSLMLIVKLNDLYIGSKQLRELYTARTATAEDKKPEEKPAEHGDKEAAADAKPAEGKPAEGADHKADEKPAADKPAEKMAEEKKAEEKPAEHADKKDEKIEEKKDEKAESHGESGEKKEGKKAEEEPKTYGTGKSTVKEIEALKARDNQPLFSQTEIDLLQNLSKRREELDQREKDLDIKAKVLGAAEKRVNDKVLEMKTLEGELSKVIAQYNEKQDEQIKSLVKIYENMKPDEAAAIFNEMEMPILLEVISKMSERKVAPVLANMNPKKAKDVTQELAEKRKRTEMGLRTAGQ